jgi:hypothetical protein
MHIWHYDFHRVVARERLAFVLVAFPHSAYRRYRSTSIIELTLAREGIRSFALWELLGEYDVLVQAWLPPDVKASQLGHKIEQAVPGLSVTTVPMTVTDVIAHWLWPKTFEINDAIMAVDANHFAALKEPDYNRIPTSSVKKYASQGYVAKLPDTASIKFFLRISLPKLRNYANEQELLEAITQALSDSNILSAAVLEVDADALYLVTGRVRPSHFSDIAKFADNIRASGRLAALGSRTTTHISGLHMPIARHEQLLPESLEDPAGKPVLEDVKSLLLLAESDELEFKASALTDIAYAVRKPKDRSALPPAKQVLALAKAICGMANANGGVVVVGVAELGDPPKRFDFDELRRSFPSAVQVNAERAIIGVDHEYPDSTGWDRYERDVRSKLKALVDGGLDSRIRFYEVRVENAVLCIIRVPRGRRFYFVTPNKGGPVIFYGREGGQTQSFEGQRMMTFMDEHPRQ